MMAGIESNKSIHVIFFLTCFLKGNKCSGHFTADQSMSEFM